MRMTRLGRSNLAVSEFCLGTMMFGGKTSREDSVRIIHAAVDAGVNFVDTADVYNEGRAEQITGEALRGIRERVVLASKVGMKVGEGPNDVGISRYHIIRGVEASLRRLDTDRLDLLYIHWPFERMNLEEMVRAVEDLVRAGKVLYTGCSNFPAWLLVRSLWLQDVKGFLPFGAGQYPYNLIERGLEVEILPAAAALGIATVIYRPLCVGLLTGKYVGGAPTDSRGATDERVARWGAKYADGIRRLVAYAASRGASAADVAVNWVTSHPAVTAAIVGISRMDQLEANLKGFEWKLTPGEREQVTGFFASEVQEEAGGRFPSWRRSYDIA
jgi:1-deoxyxylulose-5-phosphate synthase